MTRIPFRIEPISWGSPVYKFWCPACSRLHFVNISKYYFNESLLWPTLLPPVYTELASGNICDVSIEQGRLHYTLKSTHALAGRQIDALPLYLLKNEEK
jgi:hypothetical protein